MTEQDESLTGRTTKIARRLWGLAYLRGILFLVIGVVLFVEPDRGIQWLTWLVAAMAVIQGVLFLIEAGRQRKDGEGGVWRWVVGGLGIAVGITLAVWPSASVTLVLRLVGIWALVAGLVGLIGALRARRTREPGWDWELATAALWVVFGILVLVSPVTGLQTITVLLGLYLVVTGVVILVAAFAQSTAAKDAKAALAGPAAPAGPVA
ncbi:HdeD family acid-resistance protein [Oerskovia enterophila]|uniref:Acid-resistance membrane protein n=2 Tax=Oerskovia enterophila TaxID=43678 RepID=A0A163PX09_9CELL|nr:DUF308 domain-containing protein [Oerskovia enterophila]KZM33594.1 acid-resistance membrane protein [Oerskovia enterophila]